MAVLPQRILSGDTVIGYLIRPVRAIPDTSTRRCEFGEMKAELGDWDSLPCAIWTTLARDHDLDRLRLGWRLTGPRRKAILAAAQIARASRLIWNKRPLSVGSIPMKWRTGALGCVFGSWTTGAPEPSRTPRCPTMSSRPRRFFRSILDFGLRHGEINRAFGVFLRGLPPA
jgi:hypothetical protein